MGSEEEEASRELAELMQKLKLTAYVQKAEAWRQDMGAASLDEIRDNIDDFMNNLQLKPLEIRRMKKYFGDVATPTPSAPTPSASGYSGGAETPNATSNSSFGQASPERASSGKFGDPSAQEYLLYEELGSGATATVYRCAKANNLTEHFAVKTINIKSLQMQPQFKRMSQVLNREMQILFGLKHPRIVQLYDVVEEPEKLYLVMEIVSDGELFDYIVKRGTLSEPGARNVFCQIVDALKYIHSKDIVYRDLKPENILVSGKAAKETELQIKLSDFGHSKLVNDGYSTALTRVGTPQYWAPEVSDPRMSAQGYDHRVDLWSLGVVLYVMLMGSYPFDGVREPIERQIQNPQLTFRSPVTGRVSSADSQTLINSLIKVRPNLRKSLEDCLKHPWTQATDVVQTSADNTGYCAMQLPHRASKPQRDQMVQDLLMFQKKFKCFAQVRRDHVIADLDGVQQIEEAKSDLKGIIRCHFGGYEPLEQSWQSLSGDGLAAIDEAGGAFRLLTTTLRVGAEGAGVDLVPENGGMFVQFVCDQPGQPELKANDLITKINEISLAGAPEMVESIFGHHFGDGVQISVKRQVHL